MMEGRSETPSAAMGRLRAEREANPNPPTKVPKKLPLSAIHVEPCAFQVREVARIHGPDPDRVEEIARGLDGSNLDEPIHVWWSGLRWVVFEGHHRHAAYVLRRQQTGETLQVPVEAHAEIPLEKAIGLAGRLNNREKFKISKAEMTDNALRMVCIGEGSIKEQASLSGISKSQISNIRGVVRDLTKRGLPKARLVDAGWKQCLEWSRGRTHRDHRPDALEAMAQEMAEELDNLKVTTVLKSPDVFARAIEILSPALPARLLESEPFWDALNTLGRALLAETDAESTGVVDEF